MKSDESAVVCALLGDIYEGCWPLDTFTQRGKKVVMGPIILVRIALGWILALILTAIQSAAYSLLAGCY